MITSKTQHGKMLIAMSCNINRRWLPEEFMERAYPIFIGYEANTRMSDLLRFGLVTAVRYKSIHPDYKGNSLRKCYKINEKGLKLVLRIVEGNHLADQE